MIRLKNKTILVTGCPGFIGAALVMELIKRFHPSCIISVDNLNNYYERGLKEYRLKLIEDLAKKKEVKHLFLKGSVEKSSFVKEIFKKYRPSIVIHLAAQAGVRYSINHPQVYVKSNIIGFFNILEACRYFPVKHLVYASSSSVYGGNTHIPFSVDDKVDHPVSLYAATKKSDELFAYAYSKLYNIPSTGLRFFTVYGPAGRPDMFYYSAVKTLLDGGTIKVFNYGNCKRDFTYIDDIVEGVIRVVQRPPVQEIDENGVSLPPYALYNIGGGTPVNLLDFITVLQEELVKAKMLPSMHIGSLLECSRETFLLHLQTLPHSKKNSDLPRRSISAQDCALSSNGTSHITAFDLPDATSIPIK